MVVTAESAAEAMAMSAGQHEESTATGVQDPGLRAAVVDAAPVEAAAAGRRRKKPRPDARTEFRGVIRVQSGRYGAQIKLRGQAQRWLGTFDTAEEAARAYDAAAVEHHGAAARTNFPCDCKDYKGASAGLFSPAKKKTKKKKEAVSRPNFPFDCEDNKVVTVEPTSPAKTTTTKKKKVLVPRPFRGVSRSSSGRYGAQIIHSGIARWLGSFDTAEDAARAYDAAAVELHGARAVTNFMAGVVVSESSGQAAGSVKMKAKKPAAAGPVGRFVAAGEEAVELPGVGAVAETNCAVDDGEKWSIDILADFPELPAVCFSESLIPGPLLDDFGTDLTPAERQLLDEFFQDMDFTDVVN